MKCPNCGSEIGTNKVCDYCGTQISYEMQKEQEQLKKAGCPKCGSTNIQFKRENQGEVRGKHSKQVIHRTVGFCKDCGATWYTSGSDDLPKKGKTWLWVLGWIFIFPLPLTILMLRQKEMKPAVKYGIIVAAWILYVIIGLTGQPAKNTETPTEPTAIVEEATEETQSESEDIQSEASNEITNKRASVFINDYNNNFEDKITDASNTSRDYKTTASCSGYWLTIEDAQSGFSVRIEQTNETADAGVGGMGKIVYNVVYTLDSTVSEEEFDLLFNEIIQGYMSENNIGSLTIKFIPDTSSSRGKFEVIKTY